jgi:hypothetical protein
MYIHYNINVEVIKFILLEVSIYVESYYWRKYSVVLYKKYKRLVI